MTDLSIHWLPVLPAWLIIAIAAVFAVLLIQGSAALLRKQVPGRWVVFFGSWRVAIGVVFVLALLQPVVSYTRTVEPLPELLVLLDTSQSMGQPGSVAGQSRLDQVRSSLEKGDLANALRSRFRIHWFAFDGNAYPLEERDVTGVKPAGATTRYAESLTTAANVLRASGVGPERVLLVSDGNDLGTADPVAAAQKLGLTIDTLAPGAAPPTPAAADVVIADVQCARRILLGSETHFRVGLRAANNRGPAPLTLQLLENGTAVATQAVAFRPGVSELQVPLAHRPATVGTKHYEVRLDGAPAADPYRLTVQVMDAKNEVLILEDTWRWDFKYLRRVFEDDPSFRFTAFLSRGGNAFVQFGSPERRVNLAGFPQGRAELEGFDTIVLGDVNVKRWPRGLAPAIAQLVRDEGKSLVLLAGPNLASLAEASELNALLPVEIARETASPLAGPVDVHISEDGSRSPFFFFPQGDKPMRLPALDQIYAPRRKRPGATVLLEASRLKNTYGNLIVIAEHTVGRGRVLYVGTDTLWKWQMLAAPNQAGATPYSAFWQQAFRALTPARPSTPGVHLWLQPERSRIEAGRPVSLRAEIDADRPVPQPRIQAALVLPDDSQLPLAFDADPTDPGLLRTTFQPSLPGPHRITATLTSAGKVLTESTAVLDVETSRAERSDAGVDASNLARIATATGGQVIDPNNAETWPASAQAPRPSITQLQTVDIWENYTLLLVLCSLLGIDWLLRLLRGYV
jgi:hypothetical protein